MNTKFEDLEVYQLSCKIADIVWDLVITWEQFPKDTVGKQLVRAADSIGANISEGSGRGSYADNHRFLKISRGSLFEVKHWIERAYKRNLLTSEQKDKIKNLVDELVPRLSAYMNYVMKRIK